MLQLSVLSKLKEIIDYHLPKHFELIVLKMYKFKFYNSLLIISLSARKYIINY